MKETIIDVLENGIWDIGEHHGKIKKAAIEKLTKAVKDANNETVCRHWAYCKVRQDFGCQRIEP